jgi:hypothetical protein
VLVETGFRGALDGKLVRQSGIGIGQHRPSAYRNGASNQFLKSSPKYRTNALETKSYLGGRCAAKNRKLSHQALEVEIAKSRCQLYKWITPQRRFVYDLN